MKVIGKWESFLAKRRPPARLVFEFNGCHLKAAIAERREDQFTIIDFAESVKPSTEQALTDVINTLKSRQKKLPLEATLITSQAAASILELPLNPHAPYKREELQELVRWEFEQQLAEQNASLTLDTLLVGRRLLTESDVDKARAALLADCSGGVSVNSAPTKFAEQVVSMGLVKRGDIDDSIKMLEEYAVQDDEPVCNFFPLAEEGDAPGEFGFPWLVCGIGRTTQNAWVQHVESHGIRLNRIYPTGFVSCGAVDPPDKASSYGILDLLDGVDCYVSYSGKRLRTLRWGPAPLSARNPEALINLVGSDRLENLWISGESRITKPVASAITQELAVGVRTFARPNTGPQLNGNVSSVRFEAIVGALRHQDALAEQVVPWVDGSPPGPPWWKQAAKWWMIIGIVLSVLILASESTILLRRQSIQWALDQVNDQVDSVKGEIAKVQGSAKEAQDLVDAIAEDEADLKVKKTALDLIESGLPLRNDYAKALFIALSQSVTPNVAVNEFREERDHRIKLEAWAVTERESQQFIHTLIESLSPWGLSLSMQQVRRRSGRLNLPGYHIEIDLAPNPESASKPSH